MDGPTLHVRRTTDGVFARFDLLAVYSDNGQYQQRGTWTAREGDEAAAVGAALTSAGLAPFLDSSRWAT